MRMLAVLEVLEESGYSPRYSGALSDVALELVDSGLDYCLMKPLRLANMGFVVEQTAHVSVVGAQRILAPIIRSIIGRMDERQLRTISDYLRHLME